MDRKGFSAVIIILIVVIVLAIVGGVWYYEIHRMPQTQLPAMDSSNPSSTLLTGFLPPTPIFDLSVETSTAIWAAEIKSTPVATDNVWGLFLMQLDNQGHGSVVQIGTSTLPIASEFSPDGLSVVWESGQPDPVYDMTYLVRQYDLASKSDSIIEGGIHTITLAVMQSSPWGYPPCYATSSLPSGAHILDCQQPYVAYTYNAEIRESSSSLIIDETLNIGVYDVRQKKTVFEKTIDEYTENIDDSSSQSLVNGAIFSEHINYVNARIRGNYLYYSTGPTEQQVSDFWATYHSTPVDYGTAVAASIIPIVRRDLTTGDEQTVFQAQGLGDYTGMNSNVSFGRMNDNWDLLGNNILIYKQAVSEVPVTGQLCLKLCLTDNNYSQLYIAELP